MISSGYAARVPASRDKLSSFCKPLNVLWFFLPNWQEGSLIVTFWHRVHPYRVEPIAMLPDVEISPDIMAIQSRQ
jgi:hypothetical protein